MNSKLLRYVVRVLADMKHAITNHGQALSIARARFRNNRDNVGAFGRPRTERSVRRTFGYGRP